MGQQEQPALVVPVVFFLSRIRDFNPNRSLGLFSAILVVFNYPELSN